MGLKGKMGLIFNKPLINKTITKKEKGNRKAGKKCNLKLFARNFEKDTILYAKCIKYSFSLYAKTRKCIKNVNIYKMH